VSDAVISAETSARPRAPGRRVYAAAFGCAACGLAYELVLMALGASLIGDTLVQTSLVISTMVFAMGLGALLAKRWLAAPANAFVLCEPLVALIGGLAPMSLIAAFAWMDVYEPLVIAFSVAIGVLVGAEIPLLMVLVPGRTDASFAELLAADYLGALAAGVAVPFIIVPRFGLVVGSMVVGLVNLAMGLLVLFGASAHRPDRRMRRIALGSSVLVALILIAAAFGAPRFERSARQQLYDDPIIVSKQSAYQDIVVTEQWRLSGPRDTRLFLNGDLQFSSADEYRYHEALVHLVMAGAHRRVLILGGGDGLALREVLAYGDVAEVVLVELDPAIIELARTNATFRSLNHRAFDDPRVTVEIGDAFRYLRHDAGGSNRFDVVIADLPDPDSLPLAKLYSVEFYAMAAAALSDGGRLVVQAGSPTFAAAAYWSIVASVEAAGLATVAYHVDVPSFGDWGFVLAGRSTPPLLIDDAAPPLRSLDARSLAAASSFAPDRARRSVEPSTLAHPRIVDYSREGWGGY
jgi:spermidine synthase